MRITITRGSRRALAATALAGALATFGLTGCGGSDDAAGGSPASAPSATSAPSAASTTALTIKDPWVKATKAGEMTAAFGVLTNGTGADVTVVGAESAASPMELHEMTMKDGKMIMRPHELSPGGDHLMLMKPAAEIAAGDEVSFTLKLGDGQSVTFSAIAKPFAGAQESYDPGMPMHGASPMGSMAP